MKGLIDIVDENRDGFLIHSIVTDDDTDVEPRHDKTNKVSVRTTKTQISLGIHPV